ncbi:PREDICTED: aquaporin-like [Dufourea novaeangliae]|uniref:aquaporin-like n=1 Tax=Dufourea novaeangliae TaxID=178035 RepID=UPI000767BA73|nr:PREDICTED: aquaporin-like [Dufourea novaeangliae]
MSSNDLRSGFKKLLDGGTWELKKILIPSLAEILGTSILVFTGCMGCVNSMGVVPSHLQIALTFGLAVMIVIQSIGHISDAHVNPAITVGAIILGKKSIADGLCYLLAQILGGVMGFGMLKVVTPTVHLMAAGPDGGNMFCVNNLHNELSVMQGLLLEGIGTGILMLVACAIWDKKNKDNKDSIPIKFGFTVAALATAIGPYTGCSLNPARSFAPALWNNEWSHHWIYWFGPVGGALLSSFLYRTLFMEEPKKDEETPGDGKINEIIPLNTVDAEK